jgi:hypothetical protein
MDVSALPQTVQARIMDFLAASSPPSAAEASAPPPGTREALATAPVS